MARSSKQPHPADVFDARLIKEATQFSAHFRVGPNETHTVACGTAEDALAAAAQLTRKHGKHGRQAMAYAVHPCNGAVPLTSKLLTIARSL